MRPLSFCHLTTFYPPHNFGGDGIGVQRLVHALARRGHRVTVVHETDAYRALSPRAAPPAEPEPEPEGVEVVRLASGAPKLSLLLTQQTGHPVVNRRRIARILREGRFDVVNFHNVSLIGGPGLLALSDAAKLYMAHEHWLVCPTHVLWRHGRELCTGRECLRCVLHYRRPPQVWRSTRAIERFGRHVDVFIAMSEFSRAKHREFGFPYEMQVLPYFLPDPEGAGPPRRAGERPHQRPYFLFVGRLERIKGLDQVIPLFERVHEADLLICGTGEHEHELRRLAGGNPRVVFAGRVPSEQLARFYSHAEALIVPSVCFETFGIILIEAFRAGAPVIARRLGPFPEIVERSRAGELFSTPAELEAAVRGLCADPARSDALGLNGWRAFVEEWSESAVLPRYLALAEEAIARRMRRRG